MCPYSHLLVKSIFCCKLHFLTFSDVPTTLCYLQNWTFHPIFLFISILFALCLHKPYFSLFKCNFDSLEWQFGTYCSYVDLENTSKFKLICVPIHYYCSIPFSAMECVFSYFFRCMLDICSWKTDYTFFATTTIYGLYHHMNTKVRSIFGGSTLVLDPAPDPYLGCTFFILI